MQRAVIVLSILALVLTSLAAVGITALFLLGLPPFQIEHGRAGTLVEQLFNFGPLLPIAVTLLAWMLSVVSAVYRRRWGWVALLLLFVPVDYVCWFDLLDVVELNVGVALPLMLPLTTWWYGQQAFGPPSARSSEAM